MTRAISVSAASQVLPRMASRSGSESKPTRMASNAPMPTSHPVLPPSSASIALVDLTRRKRHFEELVGLPPRHMREGPYWAKPRPLVDANSPPVEARHIQPIRLRVQPLACEVQPRPHELQSAPLARQVRPHRQPDLHLQIAPHEREHPHQLARIIQHRIVDNHTEQSQRLLREIGHRQHTARQIIEGILALIAPARRRAHVAPAQRPEPVAHAAPLFPANATPPTMPPLHIHRGASSADAPSVSIHFLRHDAGLSQPPSYRQAARLTAVWSDGCGCRMPAPSTGNLRPRSPGRIRPHQAASTGSAHAEPEIV